MGGSNNSKTTELIGFKFGGWIDYIIRYLDAKFGVNPFPSFPSRGILNFVCQSGNNKKMGPHEKTGGGINTKFGMWDLQGIVYIPTKFKPNWYSTFGEKVHLYLALTRGKTLDPTSRPTCPWSDAGSGS